MKTRSFSFRQTCAALAAAGLTALALAPAALHADPPASGYYPDALITLPEVPDAADITNIIPVAKAMNHQGYILLGDATQIRTNAGGFVVRAPYIYVNKTLHQLNTTGLDVNHLFVSLIGDADADGAFWVAGRYDDQETGFRHPVRWHIAADGASGGPEVLRNRILPEDSSNPGEQGSAEPLGIAVDGTIAGYSQSYLVNVPQVWHPGDPAAHDIPGLNYPGSAQGVAPGGGIFGIRANEDGSSTPVLGLQPLFIPSDNYYWELNQFYAGRMVGTRLDLNSPTGNSRAFVYDLATGVTTDLPGIGSLNSEEIYYNDHANAINANGDIVGLGGSYLFAVLWKRDAATGGYTPFRIDRDLGYTALLGTTFQFRGGDSDYSLTGIADDGAVAVSRVQNYLDGSWGVIVEKPGPDPRPVIRPSDPAFPNSVVIDTKPGQEVSYRFTATNNPTSFRLFDPATNGAYVLPAGLSFDSATGVLSGAGPANGVYSFQVVATNGKGYGAFPAGVTIASGDKPGLADQSATAHLNQPFSYPVAYTGEVTSIYAYPLPEGLVMDNTGMITGTPTAAGTTTGTIYASNGIGQSTATLTITVDSKPPAAFSVSLVKPAGDVSVIVGSSVKAKAKVDLSRANGETVAKVEFLLDGQPIGSALTAKPYKESLAMNTVGVHQLTALATGNDGRVAVSTPLTVTVAAPFVDLTGSASFNTKINSKGKLIVKGAYSLTNQGNRGAGPFAVKFFVSNDASFDETDLAVAPLIAQFTDKDKSFDLAIPGLPANTTLRSSDPGLSLPAIKLSVPSAALALLHGKYILAVIDPDNAVGESSDTRANNVIAIPAP